MNGDRSMRTGELDLEAALRDLGSVLVMPSGGDVAGRVRARIEADVPRRPARPLWSRPLRRSVLLAAAALLLVVAAVTAAIGYGLPGIRILFGPPASPSPSATPTGTDRPSDVPGALLGLGTPMSLNDARDLLDFAVLLPGDPAIGPPDAAYLSGARLTLVWGPAPGLPGTANPGIGLLVVELHARVDQAMIDKIIDQGVTVEPVTVDGAPGYWISGERHELAYLDEAGRRIEDSVRVAGNTLVWTQDGISYKLEGELTREAAIAMAESMR